MSLPLTDKQVEALASAGIADPLTQGEIAFALLLEQRETNRLLRAIGNELRTEARTLQQVIRNGQ